MKNRQKEKLFCWLWIIVCLNIADKAMATEDSPCERIYEKANYVVHLDVGRENIQSDGTVGKDFYWTLMSGFVIEDNGEKMVVSNAHFFQSAVDEVKSVYCYFHPRMKKDPVQLTIVGYDRDWDLALFRFQSTDVAKDVPSAVLGSSAQAKEGTAVLAIGRPDPLMWAMTTGKVTKIVETRSSAHYPLYPYFIIHEAIINPGSSGSPLLNLDGEVLGVNAKIIFPTTDIHDERFGGAIAIDDLKFLLPHLRKGGEVKHPPQQVVFEYSWNLADVDFNKITGRDKSELRARGVLVVGILEGSFLAKNGLQVGDVLVKINNSDPPEKLGDLNRMMLLQPLSDFFAAKVVVDRYGKQLTLPLVLIREMPEKDDGGKKQEADGKEGKDKPSEEKK